MKILIIETVINKAVIKTVQSIPRVGERIDLFYSPLPIVKDIVNLPTQATLEAMGIKSGVNTTGVCAVLFVS